MHTTSTEVRRLGLLAGLLLLLISGTTSAPRWTGDFILVAYSADVVGQGSLPSRGWAQCTGTQTLKPRL